MVSVKSFIPAAAAALVSTAAFAADLPPPPPVAYQPPPPPPCCEASGWYLRGDVGVGIQNFKNFDHGQTNPAFVWPASWTINQQEIKDTTILGFGVGYEFNSWLRFDVTGEYRTKVVGKAVGSYKEFCNGGICFDNFDFDHAAAVFMANAYIDLGTWWCITPYIGGGVGGAYQRITGLTDTGIISNGTVGFGLTSNDAAVWSLAWNVQAGLTYNVTRNFKVDFNWRYLNLGSPQTSVVFCQNTPACPGAFYTLRDLTSQDFRIGLRWMLTPEPPPMVMPTVVSKG